MPEQKNALFIRTLFSEQSERNLGNLSGIYSSPLLMRKYLDLLLSDAKYDMAKYGKKTVLIKPNWVKHEEKTLEQFCLVTHPQFLLTVLEIVLEQRPKKVIIADAPIQGCIWDRLVTEDFKDKVNILSCKFSIPITIVDFRRTVFSKTKNILKTSVRDLSSYVMFNLGKNSYLEPISSFKPIFRVGDYNPDLLAETHSTGKHMYCFAREFFDADYIIALPKAKTHQKAGITNALKLLVGVNGDKNFLPHHRVGGTYSGGDCYPGNNLLLHLAELIIDVANRHISTPIYKPLLFVKKALLAIANKTQEQNISAAWYGNDTTWRMVLDVNLIASHGKSDGTIAEEKQRSVLYICDGIIGGQGDGPLKPDPLALGVMLLSENPSLMDNSLAVMMGFDRAKFPLLVHSQTLMPYKDDNIYLNGGSISFDKLQDIKIQSIPPKGWMRYLDLP